MGHKKLERFAAIKTYNNVLENPQDMKGKWRQWFGNENPIYLELACGKGEYTQNRALKEPNKNFIGIDVKGNRMYIGAKNCIQLELKNAAYLRIHIDKITEYFDKDEVDEIWIIFPDPFLRESKAKNRLTHTKFLEKYQSILKKDASINLKTDSQPLFAFTQEIVAENNCQIKTINHNIYEHGEAAYPLNIKTYYEGLHLADNRTIQYISFGLPQQAIKYVKKKKELDNDL
jgi:tRNA (guanine-N7-)-methyltransferase